MSTHRLHAHAAGSACAIVTGVLYAFCALAYALAPAGTLAFFNLLFHGLDVRKIAVAMTWGGAIAGFMISVLGAYVLTWAWVVLYNRFLGGAPAADGAHGGKSCCE